MQPGTRLGQEARDRGAHRLGSEEHTVVERGRLRRNPRSFGIQFLEAHPQGVGNTTRPPVGASELAHVTLVHAESCSELDVRVVSVSLEHALEDRTHRNGMGG